MCVCVCEYVCLIYLWNKKTYLQYLYRYKFLRLTIIKTENEICQ